ncbi:DMT family transporter [Paracraurococcus ruber]|uniref:EamA family transporter n=2 Tax=Paracraurococcus ruber TaxID=77675 RepID=A0ABS1D305_9PROT|nr:EamA family transporter [Paracraurococcus ruber]TDG28379.1 DMT family transporter [Paracraurococcus ruber]
MALPGLFWAGNAIVGRAVAEEVPPLALAFWRWVLGAAIVLPFAWPHLARDIPAMRRAWKPMLALSVLGVAVFNSCLYTAAQSTTALNIVMLQSTMPVAIVLASFVLFGERVGARQGAGIAVSLAGALVLVTGGDPGVLARLDLNRGDLWMLAGILAYSVYTALLRRRPAVHGLSFVAATFVLGALVLLPVHVADSLAGRPMPLTATALLAVGYVAVFASVLAYLCYNRAVLLLGPNTAGLAAHLVPVFGTILAVLLLGEVPRLYHAAGIALIGLGIWLAQRKAA